MKRIATTLVTFLAGSIVTLWLLGLWELSSPSQAALLEEKS